MTAEQPRMPLPLIALTLAGAAAAAPPRDGSLGRTYISGSSSSGPPPENRAPRDDFPTGFTPCLE